MQLVVPQSTSGFASQPARVSGNWYTTPSQVTTFTTASTTTTYFTPLWIISPVTIQALGVWLNTGQAGGKIQLAVYGDNGSGAPNLAGGTLISTADITATATGANITGTTSHVAFAPGLYWVAVMSNNAGIVINGVNNASPLNLMGVAAGASSQNNLQSASFTFVTGYTLTGQTYGTFPTSGSPASTTAVNGALIQYQSL